MLKSSPLFNELAISGNTIVKPGDVAWVCTRFRQSGELFLLGRLSVGQCLKEGWHRKLLSGKGEPLRAVSLMQVFSALRFVTRQYSDRLILRHGRINPEQFGSPRILTDSSAEVLNELWYGAPSLAGFKEVLEEDLRSVEAVAGYADPITNAEVESAAVSTVTMWYQDRGWRVRSVEPENLGYDLVCTQGGNEEHVEVKGTQGHIPSYFMTANEYECSENDPLFILCVVTGVLTQQSYIYSYPGSQISKEFEFTVQQYKAVPRNFQ